MRGVALWRSTSAALALALILSAASRAGAQSISSISAFTSPGGVVIAEGVWQSDNTPYFTWVLAGGAPPIAGYSWAVDASPDCNLDTVAANTQLAAQSDGVRSFQVRAIDTESGCGPIASFEVLIDAGAEKITGILAFTQSGGGAIQEGVFQMDADPFMTWTVAGSAAPLAGFSWQIGPASDCIPDTATPSVQLALLGDGAHTFSVRAIDLAGNCGDAATFLVLVDATSDAVTSMAAFTESGGASISAGVFQPDSDPFMQWTVAAGTSVFLGSSWLLDGAPDCLVDIGGTSLQLPAQGDGLHPFRVRAIDMAGNCGPVSTFQVAIDTTGDAIGSISAYTAVGGEAIPPGVAQPDADPYMEWTVSGGLAPLLGSSWMLDGAPDCLFDTSGTSVQLPAQGDGPHEFQVRAIDAAGNCGPVATFELAVQTGTPPVSALGSFARITLVGALLLALSLASKDRTEQRRRDETG